MTAVIDTTLLFQSLALDVGLDRSSIDYCLKRLESEGTPFLTKILPGLSKAVLHSLEKGVFVRPLGFSYKRETLQYFRCFLDKIFCPRTGNVLPNVCPVALKSLRQLCEYFYKLALPFDEAKLLEYEEKFVEVDEELFTTPYDKSWVDVLRKDFERYYPSISGARIEDVFSSSRPRPGSGTFSNHLAFQQAWYLKKHSAPEIRGEFKALAGYFKPYPAAPELPQVCDSVDYSEVLFVPKDSRGPRTIVREPFHTLNAQMGFHDWIKGELERSTSYRVNFVSQSTNRRLAHQSSKDRSLATIDLKDASDRVSFPIMSRIFEQSPACRYMLSRSTRKVKLPSGSYHNLNKVAGMGSGLTFPLMSLLITLTITRKITNCTSLTYRQARKLVYVYGDDIIVPTKYVRIAYAALEQVLLMVNVDKSYSRSLFRESCGGDFYDGHDVAPTRLKLTNSGCIAEGPYLKMVKDSWPLDVISHAKVCVQTDLPRTAEYMYRCAEKRFGPLPAVSGDSPVLGRWSSNTPVYPTDADGTYREVRALVAIPVTVDAASEIDPYVYLGSKFNRQVAGFDPLMTEVDSSRSAYGEVSIPRQVKFKRVKISAFRLMG